MLSFAPVKNKSSDLANAVLACLFAALISVGSYVVLPVPGSPVPIALQNMFVMLAALLLGPFWGAAAVVIFLFFGALGLPVFSGGTGGFARLLGPTGGYLVGYLPAALAMGFVAQKAKLTLPRSLLACVAGEALIYLCGVSRLKTALNISWSRALAAGLYPFLVGDGIKIALASLLGPRLSAGIETLKARGGDA